jgi:hypothetical protein
VFNSGAREDFLCSLSVPPRLLFRDKIRRKRAGMFCELLRNPAKARGLLRPKGLVSPELAIGRDGSYYRCCVFKGACEAHGKSRTVRLRPLRYRRTLAQQNERRNPLFADVSRRTRLVLTGTQGTKASSPAFVLQFRQSSDIISGRSLRLTWIVASDSVVHSA